MIAVFSTDQNSDLSDFLISVSQKLNEANPSKIAVMWDTPDGILMGMFHLDVSDMQRFGMDLVTEGIVRTVAYSQDYIEQLQAEAEYDSDNAID